MIIFREGAVVVRFIETLVEKGEARGVDG